jgi:hypothetical protein
VAAHWAGILLVSHFKKKRKKKKGLRKFRVPDFSIKIARLHPFVFLLLKINQTKTGPHNGILMHIHNGVIGIIHIHIFYIYVYHST